MTIVLLALIFCAATFAGMSDGRYFWVAAVAYVGLARRTPRRY